MFLLPILCATVSPETNTSTHHDTHNYSTTKQHESTHHVLELEPDPDPEPQLEHDPDPEPEGELQSEADPELVPEPEPEP